jgi:DNA-binding protein YbaB
MDPRLERLLDRARADLDDLRTRTGTVTGSGEALDGLVRVTCRPGGVVDDVVVDPRAMRHRAAELAEAFREAHAAASRAASAAVRAVLAESGTFAEIGAQLDRGTVDVAAVLERQGLGVRDLVRRLGGA